MSTQTDVAFQAFIESLRAQVADLQKMISTVPAAQGHSLGVAVLVLNGIAKATDAAHAATSRH